MGIPNRGLALRCSGATVAFVLLNLSCTASDPVIPPEPRQIRQADIHDDIVAYAQACAAELGVELPDINCRNDGAIIPITVNGNPVTFATDPRPDHCDRPVLLPFGTNPRNQCVPYTRLIKQTNGDVVTQVICRRYLFREEGSNDFDDIGVIQFNNRTYKACWFATPTGDIRNGNPVPPPYRSTWGMDEAGNAARQAARAFWDTPDNIAGIQCLQCHDNDIWIHSPYVDQITNAQAVPSNPHHPNAINIGEPFATTVQGWQVPKRMKFQRFFLGVRFPLDAADRAAITTFGGSIARDDECTRCHHITKGTRPGGYGTCDNFAKQAAWQVPPNPPNPDLTPMFAQWPRNHWMPPNLAPATSNATYDNYFRRSLRGLRECCDNPDLTVLWPTIGSPLPLIIPVPACVRSAPGVGAPGNARLRLRVNGDGLVQLQPTLESVFTDYAEGYGGQAWTCPLNGDRFATGDEFGRTQWLEDGGSTVVCEEEDDYFELNGEITEGVVNRYQLIPTPNPGASFQGFDYVCTGDDPCIIETWVDTQLTATFSSSGCTCAPWDGNWSPFTENPTGAGCTASPYAQGSTDGYNMWCWAGTQYESACNPAWRGACDGCDTGCLRWSDGYVGPDPDCNSSPSCAP